jgi:hypothetical protein
MSEPLTAPANVVDHVATTLARALGSQYQIVRLVGRGGMGAVYHAREPFLERDVAVKVLPAELASGSARERFLREARTAAKLSHPNIVPLYTFGQADDLLYYVMGFVDGESVEDRLRREGRIAPDDVRRITSELADALDYAHQLGVVHRDIKPDNVLLDRVTGRAMLTDFGIAKQQASAETLTQTGMVMGTPHYMSPEQASGERAIDGRSDIYSLGVMAYRMVTGRLPFDGASMRDVLSQHITRAPVPANQLVTTLPLDIDTAISRAMEKNPAARWPSARVMKDALSPESEESVPEPLRVVTCMGSRLLLMSAGLLELAFLSWRFGWGVVPVTALAVGGVVTPLVAALGLIPSVRGYGWRAAVHRWLLQPTWWTLWWPKRLRRHGDIAHRLPRDLAGLRAVSSVGMFVNLMLANAMVYGVTHQSATGDLRFMRWFVWVAIAMIVALFGPLVYFSRRFQTRAKALGLSKADIERAMSGATWRTTFWGRPHIAALLTSAPAAATVRADTRDARALLAEIDTIAAAVTTSIHADILRDAGKAASALVAAISKAEQELVQLARDVDPNERARIQAGIDALGPAGTRETAAKAEMRELLDRQLRLLGELTARREEVAQRRDHQVEQLRLLALQLARLRSADASDEVVSAEITARIRAIVGEIDQRVGEA